MGAAAVAQPVPQGCFARDYDAAHLAAHPEQVVDWITIRFAPWHHADATHVAYIRAGTANQGHAGDRGLGGRQFSDGALNWMEPLRFGIECDGGNFLITRHTGYLLEIQTQYLRLSSDGCGEGRVIFDLAERQGEQTTYRLFAADPAVCESQ
jgi:hypothetical protein